MTFKEKYIAILSDRRFVKSLAFSFFLLIFSLIVNYFAALYAYNRASNHVEDIVLSNIPAMNVDLIFIWGPLIFWLILIPYLLINPRRVPFMLKSISLFVIIRSFFISLTHLGPSPYSSTLTTYGGNLLANILETNPATTFVFSSGADLFFSGHTGLPFLLALIFWKDVKLRVFCLISSVFFGVVVLLGHLHYTIDVVAAFFITYSISHIANIIFRTERSKFTETYTQKT